MHIILDNFLNVINIMTDNCVVVIVDRNQVFNLPSTKKTFFTLG